MLGEVVHMLKKYKLLGNSHPNPLVTLEIYIRCKTGSTNLSTFNLHQDDFRDNIIVIFSSGCLRSRLVSVNCAYFTD